MIPYAELEKFFCDLVAKAQGRGIPCAITSGMACVHFGVAATTKDCDVLCNVDKSDDFRELIAETELRSLLPNYRGNISPPLDARHNVVAEMKRTNRAKDWPFATGLGGLMLVERNPKGWLHVYDMDVLRHSLRNSAVPADLLTSRPLLKLAPFEDSLRVKRILMGEQVFWSELDEIRVRIFQQHLRPYVSAVRRATAGRRDMSVTDSHAIRVDCAEQHLPQQPLRDYGLDRMLEEARQNVAVTVGQDVIEWLPTAERNFYGL